MTFLHNPLTADLIRCVVPLNILLVNSTTAAGSAQRFDRLCQVLGDGIIGSIWLPPVNSVPVGSTGRSK